MRLSFSQREIARRAAREASERYEAQHPSTFFANGGRFDYWAYVINAALEAIPAEDDELAIRRALKEGP